MATFFCSRGSVRALVLNGVDLTTLAMTQLESHPLFICGIRILRFTMAIILDKAVKAMVVASLSPHKGFRVVQLSLA